MPKKPVIAYISSSDPLNKRVWSGTHYSIYTCLKQMGEVTVCGPYEPKWQLFLGAVANQFLLRLFGKRFDYRHSFLVSKRYGKYFQKKIDRLQPDIIVAPAASAEIAFLTTTIPIIYITDGTFGACLNYHKVLTNLVAINIREGNEIERLSIQKSRYVVVSSQWAANSVHQQYNKQTNQIKCFPYGANFDQLPDTTPLTNAITPFKLLFVGVYWESKGGAIAYRAFKLLKDQGLPVTLTIMGCTPPADCLTEGVELIPFLDKNSTEGQEKMKEVYASHHLLILPTRFDCTPIVINEASAFALPSLVADTGGVAGHLKDGVNGFLVPYSDEGSGYAKIIKTLFEHPERYQELRKSSRDLYLSTLNWESWKKSFESLLTSLL